MDINKKTKSALEFLQAGNEHEAEQIFRDILKAQPDNVNALHFIGLICYRRKENDSAIAYIKKALQIAPDYVDAYNNLGSVLQETGRLDEAEACYKKALELNPGFVRAYNNLANAFKEKWRLDEAILNYRKAIQLSPELAEPYNGLGNALQEQGKLEEAERCYRHAINLKPLFTYYDNLLMMLNYSPRQDAAAVFSDHLKFAEQFEAPLAGVIAPHRNDCLSDRRLRIGYVSPDFRRHSVKYFIVSVLSSHSRDRFEVFCYSDVLNPDDVTERIRGCVDHWHDINGMPDEKAAELIRKEGIDILVDLAGHTANNRMLLFARKPAPVQVSWIGYPNTTGLSAMDYRIVDSYTDPPGLTDQFYTEKLVRMPESFLCYLPENGSPAVGSMPALKAGYITFGSFNYFPKVSPEAAGLWSKILNAVSGSRLVLKTRNFADSATRRYAAEMFTREGVAAERIELLSMKTSFREHLDMYNRIDVALDTFPYNGTTTTCEALWMGVPVVALAGNTHASRVGVSLLSNIGLPELVSETAEGYVSIAVNLAGDLKRSGGLRETLRDRMSNSALTDAKRFAVNLENCYRSMWQKWCDGKGRGREF